LSLRLKLFVGIVVPFIDDGAARPG